ncbi:Zinc finger, RING-CH-type, partial [Cynara cardunculus var. scolymus]
SNPGLSVDLHLTELPIFIGRQSLRLPSALRFSNVYKVLNHFLKAGEDLIAPCHCRGTQKYVHRSCLDNWRSTREGFAFSHCTECRAVFILRANVPHDRWWLRLKFQLLVARDHAFIFVIVQLIVAFLGVLVYKFYGDELREMFGYEEHPYGFYTMAVLAIVLVGLLYGFFIAIICGQRINERHYHILAKQELTKEYIVEDREVNKDVAELDPSHVTELRMLQLIVRWWWWSEAVTVVALMSK